MFGWFSVFFFGVTAVLFGQRMFLTAAGHNLGVCLVFYLCVLCVCCVCVVCVYERIFYLCAFVLVMLMCMFVRVVLMCMGEISGPKTRSA